MKPLMLAEEIDTYNIPSTTGHPMVTVMKGIQEGEKCNLFYKIPKLLLIRTQYLSQMQAVAWVVTLRTLTPLRSLLLSNFSLFCFTFCSLCSFHLLISANNVKLNYFTLKGIS